MSENKFISGLKNAKIWGWWDFILIGFEFLEFEGKNSEFDRQQWQKIKRSRDHKLNRFLLIKNEVII